MKPRKKYNKFKNRHLIVENGLKNLAMVQFKGMKLVEPINVKTLERYKISLETLAIIDRTKLNWCVHYIIFVAEQRNRIKTEIHYIPVKDKHFHADLYEPLNECYSQLYDNHKAKDKIISSGWIVTPKIVELNNETIEAIAGKFFQKV